MKRKKLRILRSEQFRGMNLIVVLVTRRFLKYRNPACVVEYDMAMLTSILIGEELSDQIRTAFDVQIFSSYRKNDLKQGKKLMLLIHKIPL